MTEFDAPRKLAKSDVRAGFASGAGDLDEWLVKFAWENQQANNATTYVITNSERVVAYYAIAISAVARLAAPKSLQSSRPSQVSCVLLARLAVDVSCQGQGLGWELLRDALLRSVILSESIGAAAVLVHCRDESTRSFYLHHGNFQPSPVDALHLLVSMKTLRRYVD